jgi:orotidine-5'-phosphate decarboxylase
MIEARSRLIVALDLPDRESALSAVNQLAGHIGCFKMGLEIFVREGPRFVEEIIQRGERVFLDLKLHDIPNTVGAAVRAACALGVHMLTLHAAGGRKMLETAARTAQDSAHPPLLLAVTALTSLSPEDIDAIGLHEPASDWVVRLAEIACGAGIPGLVSSSLELPVLKERFGEKFRFVVPGIRPKGAATNDQSRIASPGEAILAGADFLVVGRPILQSPDPALAADQIVAEMDRAFRGKPGE